MLISSGIGRTGVFITLPNLIDQAITEDVVNVYQTVKKMRQQRSSKILTRVSSLSFPISFCPVAPLTKPSMYKTFSIHCKWGVPCGSSSVI